jgi:hypothetical protein
MKINISMFVCLLFVDVSPSDYLLILFLFSYFVTLARTVGKVSQESARVWSGGGEEPTVRCVLLLVQKISDSNSSKIKSFAPVLFFHLFCEINT